MTSFTALVIDKVDQEVIASTRKVSLEELPEGELLIRVAYSSVNYKDALACSAGGNIVKTYPFIPGIDLAGTVETSTHPDFAPGDEVIVTGYELGVSHYGGLSEYARVPAKWALKRPSGLSSYEAMILGTAGFTAGLSVLELERHGIRPEDGPVLVTGASGGVGSIAAAIMAKLGYEVEASTGKPDMHEFLHGLGIRKLLSREELVSEAGRALGKQQWAAAIDCVGGQTLASILPKIKYEGAIAACGLAGGTKLETTVFPFILRGVTLVGIDSVMTSREKRSAVWELLANSYKPAMLHDIGTMISLDKVSQQAARMLQGDSRGRTVVKL